MANRFITPDEEVEIKAVFSLIIEKIAYAERMVELGRQSVAADPLFIPYLLWKELTLGQEFLDHAALIKGFK